MTLENSEDIRMKSMILDRIKKFPKNRINEMLNIDVIECSYDDCSAAIGFRIEDWMLNPSGLLHGGLLSTFLDVSMGLISIYLNNGTLTPTASLSVTFIRPVHMGDRVIVKARCHHSGRTMTQATASAYSEIHGTECALASAVFSKSTPNGKRI